MFRKAIPSLSLLVLLLTFAVLATVVGAETTEQILEVAPTDVIETAPASAVPGSAVSASTDLTSAVDFTSVLEPFEPSYHGCQTDEDCLCVCFDGGTCEGNVCNCH